MAERAYVVGVGMTPFVKPSSRPGWDYPDMVREAATSALEDAGLGYEQVEQVAAGYCFADTTAGQRATYELGHTGVPVINVNNACATGSTALYVARSFVVGGIADCTLALGFDKMDEVLSYHDRAHPIGRHLEAMARRHGPSDAMMTAQLFGNAGREHMDRYGTKKESFARVAVKNHRHSVHNDRAQFQREFDLEEVLSSKTMYEPLTLLQCCPTSSGAAAAVVASEEFVRKHDLGGRAVEIAAQAMATDLPSTFEDSDIKMIGSDMTRSASRSVYEASGLGPHDVDVIELHDCFSTNELITYEALGLCDDGKGGELIDSGAVTHGGEWVVNPSGGLISKGHPIGATGLAQCAELVWQLRGEAGERQVDGARVGLQQNLGLGGAAVVTLYQRT